MSTTNNPAKLSPKLQRVLTDIHQDLTATFAFYRAGIQQFSREAPYAICAELADRHLQKLNLLLQTYGLTIEANPQSVGVELPSDEHEAGHAALKLALDRDLRYKTWIADIAETEITETIGYRDIHQLLTNIEHGIHDRGIPSFKQYLEHGT